MRKLLIIIGSILAILIIAALIAPHFISEESVKNQVLAKIQASTGRKIDIGGSFRIKFFPIAGAHVENVTISNPAGFNDSAPFMTLKDLDVDMAVLPLLHGGVEVKKLVLNEPNINMHALKDGRRNWEFAPQEKPAATTAAPSESKSGATAVPANLSLSNFKISGGNVAYNDEATGQRWAIKKLNSDVELDGYNSPFSIDGNGEWNGKTVKINGKMTTLASLMSGASTKVNASIKSDLLSFDADGTIAKQVYTGKTSVKSDSLRELLVWVNPGSKPMAVSSPLALDITGNAECSASSCGLSNAVLKLDKLQAKGSVKAAFGSKTPVITADLTTDMLDLTAFMPPPQHASLGNPLIADAFAETGWSTEPMNFTSLQAVDANLVIYTGGIALNKITIGKTLLKAQLQHGQLNANMLDADMYGGKGNVTITIDAGANPPAISDHVTLQNIQAEPLLKDLGATDRFSGTAAFELSSTSHGKSEEEIVSSMNGSGSLKVVNGVIRGVNFADMAHNIKSAFGNSGGSDKTNFSDLSGTFTITQGTLNNKDLSMTATGMKLAGAGDVNLPQRSIHYKLTPQLTSTQNGVEKQGVAVPIIVSGSFDHPTYQPDLNSIVQQAIQNPEQLQEQLKNTRKDLRGQLPQGTGKTLKGLLKGLKGN